MFSSNSFIVLGLIFRLWCILSSFCVRCEVGILFYLFFLIILFLAVLGSSLLHGLFSGCSDWGLLFIAVDRLPIAVASLVECGP